jgi:hypothetical protein
MERADNAQNRFRIDCRAPFQTLRSASPHRQAQSLRFLAAQSLNADTEAKLVVGAMTAPGERSIDTRVHGARP